jgi:DNA excision repair protein ERCC-2
MLGLPPSTQKIQFDSPFPQQNRVYLLIPNLSTRYEDRQESYDQIARIICNTIKIRKGNYLSFFPSFAYLKAVQREIEDLSFPPELIVQERKMSESKRRNILKKLKSPNGNYLLLAVHGGIFSEGVDFIGDMAIGAFIIGPGLPSYTMEQDLMQKYFELKWKKGFEYAYRNPGMMRVIQAAGRIFRTSTDRGFVMLIGHRFNTQYYNCVLPGDWKIEYSSDHIKRIQNFWGIQDNQIKLTSQKKQEIKKEKVDLFNFIERL